MGIFDFGSKSGDKVFKEADKDKGAKIKAHLEKRNAALKNLRIKVDRGVATVEGEAKTSAQAEKAVLLAGNVEGVRAVVAKIDGAKPSLNEDEYYVVQKRDTLSGIALKLLGNAMRYPEIFEANREIIKDPNLIYPGQKIRIPRQDNSEIDSSGDAAL